jgi:hypothetical protein
MQKTWNQNIAMKKVFRYFLVFFGIVAIGIAIAHLILGPESIPGSIPVNATMDSEDRFYSILFGAFGLALIWCSVDIESKSKFVYFLAATFFVGGLARLISMVVAGLPNDLFIFLTVLELIIPIYMFISQHQISSNKNV